MPPMERSRRRFPPGGGFQPTREGLSAFGGQFLWRTIAARKDVRWCEGRRSDHSFLWLPSQKGAVLVCLHAQNHFSSVASAV